MREREFTDNSHSWTPPSSPCNTNHLRLNTWHTNAQFGVGAPETVWYRHERSVARPLQTTPKRGLHLSSLVSILYVDVVLLIYWIGLVRIHTEICMCAINEITGRTETGGQSRTVRVHQPTGQTQLICNWYSNGTYLVWAHHCGHCKTQM